MPPKPDLSREQVLQAAFDMMRAQGPDAITARGLAERLHCSTQPIYRLYRSMEELKEQVYDMAVSHVLADALHAGNTPVTGDSPSVTAALRYCMHLLELAEQEKEMFRFVFFSGVRPIRLDQEKYLGEELATAFMRRSSRLQEMEEQQLRDIYLKLTVYMMGLAALMNAGAVRLELPQAVMMLREMYEVLVKNSMLERSGL